MIYLLLYNNMKNFLQKFKWTILGALIPLAGITFASQITVPSASGPGFFLQSTTTGQYLPVSLTAGTNVSISTTTSNITINSTASGTSIGTISTSTALTIGQLLEVTGTGYPSLVTSVGTSTPTVTYPVQYSGTLGSFVGGSVGTLSLAFGTTTANTWSGLQTFTNTGTTTFSGGIAGTYLNLTGTSATSTFANGIDLYTGTGCFSVNGTCLQTIVSSASAYKQAVTYTSTSTLPSYTYSNGVNGVGATITSIGLQAFYIDGNTPSVNARVLIKNETGGNQPYNGIYNVTTVGISGVAAFVLTRATDYNSSADVFPGVSNFTNSGTVNANTCWVLTNTTAVTIGTTNLTYDDACGAGSFTATSPLSFSGTTISLGIGGGLDVASGNLIGQVSTSSVPTLGQISYWTGIGTPSSLGSVGTTTLAIGASLSNTGTLGFQIGGTASTLSINTANTNTWSVLQNFNYSSSTIYSSFITSTTTTANIGTGNITQITATNASTTKFSINNVTQYPYKTPGFSIATTTAWTGTTTVNQLPSPFTSQTINSVQCYTDAGTLNVDIYHTTTHLIYVNASTTQGLFSFTTNNTMTAGEKWYFTAGTPASSPTTLSCTFNLSPFNY